MKATLPLSLLLLLLTHLLGTLSSATAQSSREIEIKFVMQGGAASHAAAWKLLDPGGGMLKDQEHTDEEVCFFNTDPPSLGDLILRARNKKKIDPDKPGKVKESTDSTVKVRVDAHSSKPPGDFEKSIPAEEDWTGASHANLSRSVDWKASKKDDKPGPTGAAFAAAVKNPAMSKDLFQGTGQSKLIHEHFGSLDWSTLKCYGPVRAQVWKETYKVGGAFPKATIEDWTLETPGKAAVQVLEISVKLTVADDADAKAKAGEFFTALKDAGFGSPQTTSKTALVLEYYKPAH